MHRMMEKGSSPAAKFHRWLMRFCFALLGLGMLFLLMTLINMLGKLESLAPAEMRLLLEIIKNRFFR
jgi:hypothetical protein